MAIADTLTTREAVRRAALEDIIARCDIAAVAMEGGELDGLKVVSMGVLREQVSGALMVKLPEPSEKWAEVSTPATIVTSAICPECDLPVVITVKLGPKLTVDDDGAELSIKSSSKGVVHVHGQLTLPEGSQLSMDDVVIDDVRLRILRAVGDVGADHVAEVDPGPPPTLDAIAVRLEYATESDRSDLEDSLHGYAVLEEPLVEILSATGAPPEYILTAAGSAMVAVADVNDEMDEEDDEPPDGAGL